MAYRGFWITAVTLLVLSTTRLIAGMYESMTDNENQMMAKGEFVFSTLCPQRVEALFEDFEIAFYRTVKLNSNLTDDHYNWLVYLPLPHHLFTIQVRITGGERCMLRVV